MIHHQSDSVLLMFPFSHSIFWGEKNNIIGLYAKKSIAIKQISISKSHYFKPKHMLSTF